jgi:hypothetical protein
MKIGDRFEVSIKDEGQYFDVTEGVVQDIDDGVATIVIPATTIQVQIKETADFAYKPPSDGPDRILAGEQNGTFVEVPPPNSATGTGAGAPVPNRDYIPDDGTDLKFKELDSSALD